MPPPESTARARYDHLCAGVASNDGLSLLISVYDKEAMGGANQPHIPLAAFNSGKSPENEGSFLNFRDTEEVTFSQGGVIYVVLAPSYATNYGATEQQVWVSPQAVFARNGLDLGAYTDGQLQLMQYPPSGHGTVILERSGAAL